jgi:hypothetical protein
MWVYTFTPHTPLIKHRDNLISSSWLPFSLSSLPPFDTENLKTLPIMTFFQLNRCNKLSVFIYRTTIYVTNRRTYRGGETSYTWKIIACENNIWRVLFSGICHVIWRKFTNILKEHTASIFRVPLKHQQTSTGLYSIIFQMIILFSACCACWWVGRRDDGQQETQGIHIY